MQRCFPAALAAALCAGLISVSPVPANAWNADKQTLRDAPAKPKVKSRYGTTVTSGKAAAKAKKPVPVTTRFSGKSPATKKPAASALKSGAMQGTASYYRHGKRTANGEAFNPMGLTAAHRTLPFGTKVKVTHAGNGRSVVVRINDRGPFVHGRIIDLAMGAARTIGVDGVAKVSLQVLN